MGRKIDIPAVNASLPELVDIGVTHRLISAFRPPADVGGPRDLPKRMFLGDLVPDSFRSTPSGWEARYADEAPDTRVRVRYDRARNWLAVEQTWRGRLGLFTCARVSRWEEVLRSILSFPRDWNEELGRRLAREYGVAYVKTPPEEFEPVFFPDGFQMTIYLPLSTAAVRHLPAVLDRLERDARIRTGVRLTVALGCTSIYYSHDRWPAGVPRDERDLARWTLDSGVVVCQPLQPCSAPDGSIATGICRSHYGLIAECFFRDLERVLSVFHETGLLPDRGRGAGLPGGPEFKGIVLGGLGALGKAQLREPDGSRFIVYESLVNQDAFLSPDRLAALKRPREQVEADLSELIREAEKVRSVLKALYGLARR